MPRRKLPRCELCGLAIRGAMRIVKGGGTHTTIAACASAKEQVELSRRNRRVAGKSNLKKEKNGICLQNRRRGDS